jgi:hypothetical protein
MRALKSSGIRGVFLSEVLGQCHLVTSKAIYYYQIGIPCFTLPQSDYCPNQNVFFPFVYQLMTGQTV